MFTSVVKDRTKDLWCLTPIMPNPNFMVLFLKDVDAMEAADRFRLNELPSPLVDSSAFILLYETESPRMKYYCLDNDPNNWYVVETLTMSNYKYSYRIISGVYTKSQAESSATTHNDDDGQSELIGNAIISMNEQSLIQHIWNS